MYQWNLDIAFGYLTQIFPSSLLTALALSCKVSLRTALWDKTNMIVLFSIPPVAR